MTDPSDSLPELTPDQESDVRRLLADARHDEPIPADVGERLDRALAELTREEPGSPPAAPVIDLAARRRRRNAAALLAGAAAVIVAGFAIGQGIDVGGSADDSAASGGDAVADRSKASSESGGGVGLRDQSAEPSIPGPSPAEAPTFLRLRSEHLETDLTRQLDEPLNGSNAIRSPSAESYTALGCSAPVPANKYTLSELYPALFDGEPAVVALAPPASGQQRADVLSCDTAATLATASIPAR